MDSDTLLSEEDLMRPDPASLKSEEEEEEEEGESKNERD